MTILYHVSMDKKCKKCNVSKNIEEFYKQKTAKTGYGSYCKICNKQTQTQWAKKNPVRVLTYKYEITENEYANLLTTQNNTCAICRKPETNGKRLSVDHCHKTNKVRGLLCNKCNISLWRAEEYLKEIGAYLAAHS